jgi:hypothetical protein
MVRKLEALSVAVAAYVLLNVLALSSAQAIEFHSSVEHTALSGGQVGTNVFTVGGGFGNIVCEEVKFTGTGSAKTGTEQTDTPTYNKCTESAFGSSVTVTCLSCGVTFTPTSNKVDFEGEIVAHTGTGCTIHIKAQTIEGGVTYDNKTSDVLVTVDVTSKVVSTTEGGFFACGVANGTHTEGSYTGEITAQGSNTAGEPATISVS